MATLPPITSVVDPVLATARHRTAITEAGGATTMPDGGGSRRPAPSACSLPRGGMKQPPDNHEPAGRARSHGKRSRPATPTDLLELDVDALLDLALQYTFPASDPIAVDCCRERQERAKRR
jgi:hypothetical protein